MTHLLEDVLLVCTIQQALAASAVNRVTMVTLLLGIAQVRELAVTFMSLDHILECDHSGESY